MLFFNWLKKLAQPESVTSKQYQGSTAVSDVIEFKHSTIEVMASSGMLLPPSLSFCNELLLSKSKNNSQPSRERKMLPECNAQVMSSSLSIEAELFEMLSPTRDFGLTIQVNYSITYLAFLSFTKIVVTCTILNLNNSYWFMSHSVILIISGVIL